MQNVMSMIFLKIPNPVIAARRKPSAGSTNGLGRSLYLWQRFRDFDLIRTRGTTRQLAARRFYCADDPYNSPGWTSGGMELSL